MGLEKASSNTPTRVGDEVMKNNIRISITHHVGVTRPVVVFDAPNLYYDRYCKKHNTRQCTKCKKEMEKRGLLNKKGFPDQSNLDWWHYRSLEISRLPIVIEFVESRGYRPIFYCESSMRKAVNTWLLKKYPEDVRPKRDLLEKLFEDGYVVFDNHGIKPKGKDKEEDENWYDDMWSIQMALEIRKKKKIDAFIMSKDNFNVWRKKRDDLDWDFIDSITIQFEWQPEVTEFKDPTDQVFLAPKLREIPRAESIRKEIERIERRKQELQQELEDLEWGLEYDEELKEVLSRNSIISTSEDPSEDVPFREAIIKSITEAIEGKDTVSVGDIWYKLRLNGVGDLHSLDNSYAKMRLGLHQASDKVALQYMVNIFVNETGIELKPHADWEQLDVIG